LVRKGSSARDAAKATNLDESAVTRHRDVKKAREEYKAAHAIPERKVPVKKVEPPQPPSTMKTARTIILRIDTMVTQLADTLSAPLSDDDAVAICEELADTRVALEALEGKLKVR
jgi:hypothetical protein